MYHKFECIGRLGKDVEARYLEDGKMVASFSVAVNAGYGDKKQTMWVRVAAFGKTGEACNTYLKKGSLVFVEGSMNFDSKTGGPQVWTRKDGTHGSSFDMVASTVKFLDSKSDNVQEDDSESIPF